MFWSSSSKPTCHISTCNTSPRFSTVFSAIFTGTLSPGHTGTHKASQNCRPPEVLPVQHCACVNVRNALLLSTPPDPPAKFSKSDSDSAWFKCSSHVATLVLSCQCVTAATPTHSHAAMPLLWWALPEAAYSAQRAPCRIGSDSFLEQIVARYNYTKA